MIKNYRPHWMSEELEVLRDLARRFTAEEITPHQERWYEQGSTERGVWLKAGELGILLPDIAAEYGGSGGSFAYEAVVAHELSLAGDASWRPGKQIHVIAAHYIERYGTDLQGLKTRADKNGDGYVINGSKTFITNGSIGDLLVPR
jgi:acyl-CoA dehydrogenase